MRRILNKSILLSVLMLFFIGIISCEKDFTDIGTSIVSNTKFDTKEIYLEVLVTQRDIDAIRGDNILTGSIGEYWLGVYEDPKGHYEKIEASIITQLSAVSTIDLQEGVTDSTNVSVTMDNAFLKFPYLATKDGNKNETVQINGKDSIFVVPNYSLDNVLGTTNSGVSLKVYRNNTYLSTLNQQNPALGNIYKTDAAYDKGEMLNEDANFTFIPKANDTLYVYDRYLKDGSAYKDTLKLVNGNPFLVVPLDRSKIKSIFFDRFNSNELTSQQALNDYFKGLIIEASGSENSLVPFRFLNIQQAFLNPTLEINFTTTVEHKTKNTVVDTLRRSVSIGLSGIQNRLYKMTQEANPIATNQVIIQGAAGKVADVMILQGNQVQELRAKNWLINDATLTFYIDQDRDTTAIPERLFLYKKETDYSSHIKDSYIEGFDVFSGLLVKENNNNDHYSFKITDYISDVLGQASTKNSPLVLKTFNETDNPIVNNVFDSIVRSYNWNPKAVTLFNHSPIGGTINGTRKAQLKISYTEKKN